MSEIDKETKDSRSRNYLLTINNPEQYGYSYDKIKEIISQNIKRLIYYCMSKEIGLNEQTEHIHIYIVNENQIRFSRIKKLFPEAHIDTTYGTSQENKDYVFKEGKWLDDPKGETNLRDTHYEYGECPQEQPGKRTDLAIIRRCVDDEYTLKDFLTENPDLRDKNHIQQFEYLRSLHYQEKTKDDREVSVCYVYGAPGTGKTSSIISTCKEQNLTYYVVQDYKHPFDNYEYQDVLILDEYTGSKFEIQELNTYLDRYQCQLPCRFANKYALWSRVYIISNIEISNLYHNPDWNIITSFYRRIDFYYQYYDDCIKKYRRSLEDYYELCDGYITNKDTKRIERATKAKFICDYSTCKIDPNIYSTAYRNKNSEIIKKDWM